MSRACHPLRLLAWAMALFSSAVMAAGWRTDGSGRHPDATPPLHWSMTTNLLWATPLPSWGNATPVIEGNRIFLTVEPAILMCLDADSGAILWQATNTYECILPPGERKSAQDLLAAARQAASELPALKVQLLNLRTEAAAEEQAIASDDLAELMSELSTDPEPGSLAFQIIQVSNRIDRLKADIAAADSWKLPPTAGNVCGYASPTPAVDDGCVLAVFGSGVAACYSTDGRRIWARVIGRPTHPNGYSASPLLRGSTAVVWMESLIGLDAATGRELWRTPASHQFGSPIPCRVDNTDTAITPGGDVVRLSDGRPLATGMANLQFNSAILHDRTVYFMGGSSCAWSLPPGLADDTPPMKLWSGTTAPSRHYASPLYHDGLLYGIQEHGTFYVADAADGSVLYSRKLDLKPTLYPSPTLAGSLILISSEHGHTIVLKPGRSYQELARNSLEPFRACPVPHGSRIYVHTLKHLVCVGAPES